MYLSTLALSPTAAANRRIGLLIFKPEITPLPILHQLRDTTSRNPEIGLPDNHPCGLNSAEQYRTALLLYAPWVTLGLCF
jgi:hypothetical protein